MNEQIVGRAGDLTTLIAGFTFLRIRSETRNVISAEKSIRVTRDGQRGRRAHFNIIIFEHKNDVFMTRVLLRSRGVIERYAHAYTSDPVVDRFFYFYFLSSVRVIKRHGYA